MKFFASKRYQRVANLVLAGMLVVSTLTASVPFLFSQKASAASSSVCASVCTYTSIQDAIDNAGTGATITVGAGTYSANEINITKAGLSLVGQPGAKLVVPAVADGFATNALNIQANNVTVSGFDISAAQVTQPYTSFAWGSATERGIVVGMGISNFTITHNNIHDLRNGILVNGITNTGSITNNIIENTKGAISVQYTDGSGVTMSGNSQGTYGNAWAVNLHLNGHFDGANYYSTSQKLAADAPTSAQDVIRNNSAANGGWSVQDQGYSTSNRSEVNVKSSGSATNQGDVLGPIDTIANGINAVVSGGHVKTTGTINVTTGTNVTKSVIIDGQGTTDLHTTGSTQLFTFLGDGSTFENFNVTKDDNADQNIIGIQGNNTTILGNIFQAHFVIADNAGVTRALVVSTSTGTDIEGNNFISIRQPVYINDNATGTIKDNYTHVTKGFVLVANSNFSFTGNSWGTNVTDIAIIDNDQNPATPITNNYTCSVMLAIKANNADASIDNQVLTTPCPVGVPTSPQWLNYAGTVLGAYTNVNLVTPSWTAPSTGADHYEYSFTSPTNSNWSNPEAFTGTSIPDQSFNGSGNNGTEGPWQFRVRSVGTSGDTSAWATSAVITYDKTATKPTLVSPADGASVNGASVTQSWTTPDTDIDHYIYQSFNDAAMTSLRFTDNYTANHKTATNVGDSSYWWRVAAVDHAGNVSPWSDLWKLTVDNIAPTAPVVSATGLVTGQSTNSSSATATWTAPAGAVKYDYRVWTNISGDPYNGVAHAYYDNGLTGNARSGAFTEGQGTYSLQVRAYDAAGNASDWSNTFTIVYDTTGPVVAVNASTYATNKPVITGTIGADADHINVAVVDAGGNTVENGPAAYAAGDTTWSYDVQTALPNGTYTIYVKAYDAATNATSNSASIVVAVVPAVAPATTPTTTTTVTPAVTPLITPASAAAVLGATTTADNNGTADTGVKGATDTKTLADSVNSDANKGTIFGLAWYWWILILAALALIGWFIAAAIRRRNEDQA